MERFILWGGYPSISNRTVPLVWRLNKSGGDKMIRPGEAYEECVGGTNTRNGYLAHYNCHKPSSAPTWEELVARKSETRARRR